MNQTRGLLGIPIDSFSSKNALVCKIGVILHRMWVDRTNFRWTKEANAPQLARA